MPEENTLRDDLEAAVKEVEDELVPEETVAAAPEPEPEVEAAPETEEEPDRAPRRRNARGQFLADEAHPDDEDRYPNLTDERITKPPESWRPAAREGWDALPDHVKREAHRRELDIQTGQQAASTHRDLAERFEKVVDPYRPLIAAQGASDPVEAVAGLLQTAAVLQSGTPQQKAERLADIYESYGIDLETFDAVLTARLQGKPAPAAAQPEQAMEQKIQAMLDARLKPIEGRLTESQHRAAQANIEEFRQNAEFLDDVRNDMADIFDVAQKNGRQMDLQRAYDIACQSNPEISRILEARKTPDTSQKKALADSVLNGRQSGVDAPPPTDGSIRADILRSMERLEL